MKKELDLIAENTDFVAVNKPSGLLSIRDRSDSAPALKDLLQERYGEIFTVHRLDRDTSGVIIFARNEATHKHLSRQFENRETQKEYLGFVLGVLPDKEGAVDAAIGEHPVKKGTMVVTQKGKPSLTVYRVEEEFGLYSLLHFSILTGRTHQIRVHMKYLGHPIVCDPVYGSEEPVLLSGIKKKYKLSKSEEEERPLLDRLALHAQKLVIRDLQGEKHQLEAPLPKDMRALLQQLRKWRGQ
ncbi:MAG: RluA family pseudouridine synthase [Williamsia sp.]|nr:RluA family pseudouridine synthase [Williamsia sp.]